MHNIGKKEFLYGLGRYLLHSLFSLFVILSSVWLCFAIWYQQPGGWLISRILIAVWIIFALSILGIYFTQSFFSRQKDSVIYLVIFVFSLIWYFNIPAQQHRDWNPEVARIFNYEKQGDIVTIHNVRNFDWTTETDYQQRWETRRYDLNQLSGINVITSYWMGPQIAHTLVSFDFKDQAPLVFSIEIRKERTESFSALGGFFRKYELSLIAADEKDIVYTRSNIRGEQVYFYPIAASQPTMKALFLEYLDQSDQLTKQAKWYNTLTSNCTTIIFDMAQAIDPETLPKDYRLLASGYLPEYLYDLGVLDPQWNIGQWYEHAHINPRTANFELQTDQSSAHFSQLARQGLLTKVLPSP